MTSLGRVVVRVLIVWVVTALALMAMESVLSDFTVLSVRAAFSESLLIGLANALLWPILIRITLPLTTLTFGLGALILNGLIVVAASELDPGVEISSIGAGILVACGITLANTIVTSLLAIDDDDFYYRSVVHRFARRVDPVAPTDIPGVFFLEIDGLGHAVVERAIKDGNMPVAESWLNEGSHQLIGWETDWSSQTGACQAGLLHGSNYDLPAFRWWEKDNNRPLVTNHPKDATEIERRVSNGKGLLHTDGASRANIVSGDAPHTLLTMSTILDRSRPGRIGQDYFAFFANPYSVTRTLLLSFSDIVQELYFASQQRRRDIRPRIKRTFGYAFVRAWATVVQRELQVTSIIADLYAGRPVAYTTFLAYDEVAHHSGIERPDTLAVLRRVDRQIARIRAAAAQAPRPYHFVVLADHGQSQGATFLQRYDKTLEDLVRESCEVSDVDAETSRGDDAMGFLDASITEAAVGTGVAARVLRRGTRKKRVDEAVQLGESTREPKESQDIPELSVMASGCLGLISFPREPGRVTLEQIERKHPRLIPSLSDHPGVGFLLVRSEQDGAIAIGAEGKHFLDQGRVEGNDPLEPYGPNAADHVRRTDGFPHCPDIVVNSTYWKEADEVAAFEELVGSHGGMGGSQSYPFAVLPTGWHLPTEPIVGAEQMHKAMRRWLADLGHTAFEPDQN